MIYYILFYLYIALYYFITIYKIYCLFYLLTDFKIWSIMTIVTPVAALFRLRNIRAGFLFKKRRSLLFPPSPLTAHKQPIIQRRRYVAKLLEPDFLLRFF